MLRLTGDERAVRLDLGARPEFDQWRWVGYWEPLLGVVSFKRAVYERALTELAPLIDSTCTSGPVRRVAMSVVMIRIKNMTLLSGL